MKHLVESFLSTFQNSKIVKEWRRKNGSDFYRVLDDIRQNPSTGNNDRLDKEIYKGSIDNFIDD